MAKIAFMTMALLHEPYDHPRIQGFFDRSQPNLAAAAASQGFRGYASFPGEADEVWGPETIPAAFQTEACANRVVMTLSVWDDLEAVFGFAYTGVHAEALGKRKDWFILPTWPSYVAWWVEDDRMPSWDEACTRYDQLQQTGSSPEAFDFKRPFSPDGQPISVDREAAKRKTTRGNP